MIRLTITSLTPSKVFSLNSNKATIGGQHADVEIHHEGLESNHVEIIEESGQFYIYNRANDPFVTLNSIPFGKKLLSNYDMIQIGKTTIKFFGEVTQVEQEVNLQELFKEVEQLETPIKAVESKLPIIDIEEEEVAQPIEKKEEQAQPFISKRGWHRIFIGITIIVFFAMIGGMVSYARISQQSKLEQIIAAEGVADVSMALVYAQIYHITPEKQNWFDPVFLKNNLASVLSEEYPSFANIDNQGQFKNCPYILRIYTSSDLKQFLVMAQPEPSLLNWLFPKPAIAIDSKTMEMRMLFNLRSINRLLVNPNVLDSSGPEISYLIRQGELFSLSSFEADKGYQAPKALGLVRPGAENLVYNAPRYYHFGEGLLKKAISLLQVAEASHDLTQLQQQLDELARLPNFVLYSSQGMQKATKAQKALSTVMPNHPFLTAYLRFDSSGKIVGTHLLLNDEGGALTPVAIAQETFPTIQQNQEIAEATPQTVHFDEEQVDPHHPLYLQLHALALDRQRALRAVSDRMIILLNHHNEGKANNFSEHFSKLLTRYLQVDEQQKNRMMQELSLLYHEYSDLPLVQFANYVRAAGLNLVAREGLQQLSTNQFDRVSEESIAEQFKKIEAATTFVALDETLQEMIKMLNLHRIPDPDLLIKYQNEMRVRTRQQLGKFMLASESRLPLAHFQDENRLVLTHILKTSWLTDPDEYEFYLNEFDLLAEEAEKSHLSP